MFSQILVDYDIGKCFIINNSQWNIKWTIKYGAAAEWQKSEVFAFETSSWLMMKDKKMKYIIL